MMLIDGKKVSDEILEGLKLKPTPKQFFAGVVIGGNAAAASFQALKKKVAERLGVDYRIYNLAAELGNDGLRDEIARMVADPLCGGVIVQTPLPDGIDVAHIVNVIPLEKDPDVMGGQALGALYNDRSIVLQPAVSALQEILARTGFTLGDGISKKVAVVGRGSLVGKPISVWLMRKVSDLYALGRGSDLSILKQCDLVITGVGTPSLVTPDMLRDGAGLIDFGYATSEETGKLVGDFSLNGDLSKLAFYTPTPGGTGPILVAKLFENFYTLTK